MKISINASYWVTGPGLTSPVFNTNLRANLRFFGQREKQNFFTLAGSDGKTYLNFQPKKFILVMSHFRIKSSRFSAKIVKPVIPLDRLGPDNTSTDFHFDFGHSDRLSV